MEYVKRILFVILIILLLVIFFHVFIFILLAGLIAYLGYRVYLKVTKKPRRKEKNETLKVNNVIMDAEYTEKK